MSKIKARYILFDTNPADGGTNARVIPANFTPTSYTPTQIAAEGNDKISAHLKGIDTALATSVSGTSINTPNTLVKRDGSGNFAAGTITATLNGSATSAGTAVSFSGSLAGDITGTQGATVVAFVGTSSAANVHSAELIANAATNLNTASAVVRRDASGNFSAGVITGALSGNATTATTAGSTNTFTGALLGDVTGTQAATVVSFVGTSSAADVHSAELAANAATNLNTASAIVRRDASGNFTAGTITAALSGNATTATTAGSATSFTGALAGDVTGTQAATVVAFVGTSSATNVHNAELAANAATALNTVSTIVKRDSSGNFAAGTITANLTGNVSGNATTATSFTGNLAGDVTGTQAATVVAFVGTSSAASVHSAELLANAATNLNTASAIVKRDASGNFSAGTITANLTGNVTGNASSATNFSGSLAGDVTGAQGSTVVAFVAGSSAANVHSAELAANAATSSGTVSTIVKRDSSGNFTAGTITANLSGNVTGNLTGNASSATNFSGSLAGDVTGTQGATVVSFVGGVSAANVATGANLANAATQTNTASAIVRRDSSGNFTASTIFANLVGNVSGSASSATSFTGVLAGDVTGPQGFTVVATVGGVSAANVATGANLANAGTSANTASTLVKRDGSGNFAAGTVFSTIIDTSYANFTQTTAPSTPASTKASMYTQLSNGYTRLRFVDETGVTLTAMRDTVFLVKNSSGGTLSKGQAVYSSGADVGTSLPTVALSQANIPSSMPTVGLMLDTVTNGGIGRVMTGGNLTAVDTSAFTAGQTVYVSSSVAGGLTTTRPAFPNIWQRVGVVVVSNATTGVIELAPRGTHGEENGTYLPNFSVGPASGSSPVSVSFANAFTGILSWNPGANVTLALPPTQGTAGAALVNDGSGNLSWSNLLSNIDGGTSGSVYTTSQSIIGGTA